MSVQLQDRFNDPMISPSLSMFESGLSQGGTAFGIGQEYDGITRFQQPSMLQDSPFGSNAGGSGGLSSIVTQLLSVIAQLMSQMGGGMSNWLNGAGGNQHYFTSATGGSNGDPHLSFNGNTWNDMQSEPDLLHSDSIPGGFRISTQTTTPNAHGVTYNEQATITTNAGQTQVTLDKNGNATYTQYGVTNTLADGQSINLGNGETATRNQDGSLTITNTTPAGGQITTHMTENGNGVDLNITATNIDLGGTLVNGQNQTAPVQKPTPRLENWGI